MAETPEIPEANDPFSKRVAITIAILAVIVSFVSSRGDDAKTDSIIKTNLASNKWGYFQSKSIKEHLVKVETEILAAVAQSAPGIEHKGLAPEQLKAELERYTKEKEEIKKEAEELEHEAMALSRINNRCDLAILILQIAVILSSVAILSHWRAFWFASMGAGLLGTAIAVTSMLIK
jgi:hypothetical protein